MAERRTADAEQTGDTSGQAPLPLWVTIGDEDLADASIDSEEGAFIGEYAKRRGAAKRRRRASVKGLHSCRHPRGETRHGRLKRDHLAPEDEAKAGDTSGQAPLPLWVTIGDEDLADARSTQKRARSSAEYSSDDALQSASSEHELQDYILAAIEEVRRGAASTETTSPRRRSQRCLLAPRFTMQPEVLCRSAQVAGATGVSSRRHVQTTQSLLFLFDRNGCPTGGNVPCGIVCTRGAKCHPRTLCGPGRVRPSTRFAGRIPLASSQNGYARGLVACAAATVPILVHTQAS